MLPQFLPVVRQHRPICCLLVRGEREQEEHDQAERDARRGRDRQVELGGPVAHLQGQHHGAHQGSRHHNAQQRPAPIDLLDPQVVFPRQPDLVRQLEQMGEAGGHRDCGEHHAREAEHIECDGSTSRGRAARVVSPGSRQGPGPPSAERPTVGYGMIVRRFSTWETPGAAQAARSASLLSAHERTLPRTVTLPPETSTVMRRASISALRLSASSIFILMSVGLTRGLTVIRLLTPFTPTRYRTELSAAVFWCCHSTSPSRVIQPSRTVTLILSSGTERLYFRALTAASEMSVSVRSLEPGSFTSISSTTALTP